MSKKYPLIAARIEQLVHRLLYKYLDSTSPHEQAHKFIANETKYTVASVKQWKRGLRKPNVPVIKQLLRVAKEETDLGRKWATGLTFQYNAPEEKMELFEIINKCWQLDHEQEIKIIHNLPTKRYAHFVGREKEANLLINSLSLEKSVNPIMLRGAGGIGKTTLALEVAHTLLDVSENRNKKHRNIEFDTILFVSAKQHDIAGSKGIVPISDATITFQQIYTKILDVFENQELLTKYDNPRDAVYAMLGRHRTLLIIDNLETVHDYAGLEDFMLDVPSTTKILITSRVQIDVESITLDALSMEESLRLLSQLIDSESLSLKGSEYDNLLQKISEKAQGVPGAIGYIVMKLALVDPMNLEIFLENQIPDYINDIAEFYFHDLLDTMEIENPCLYQTILAASMFSHRHQLSALKYLLGIEFSYHDFERSIRGLEGLSLVSTKEDTIGLTPLVREYLLARLYSKHQAWYSSWREKWVEAHKKFIEAFAVIYDEKNPQLHLNKIESEWGNITSVIAWLRLRKRYSELLWFWQYLDKFMRLYLYWDYLVNWAKWISVESEARKDWPVFFEANRRIAGVLMAQGDNQGANSYFQIAQKVSDYVSEISQVKLLRNMATLYFKERNMEAANDLLTLANQQFKNINSADTHDLYVYTREKIKFLYWQSRLAMEKNEVDQVLDFLEQSAPLVAATNWHRAQLYFDLISAEVYIYKNEFHQAQVIVEEGIEKSERLNDKLGVVLFIKLRLQLCDDLDDVAARHYWLDRAQVEFSKLGIRNELGEYLVAP